MHALFYIENFQILFFIVSYLFYFFPHTVFFCVFPFSGPSCVWRRKKDRNNYLFSLNSRTLSKCPGWHLACCLQSFPSTPSSACPVCSYYLFSYRFLLVDTLNIYHWMPLHDIQKQLQSSPSSFSSSSYTKHFSPFMCSQFYRRHEAVQYM